MLKELRDEGFGKRPRVDLSCGRAKLSADNTSQVYVRTASSGSPSTLKMATFQLDYLLRTARLAVISGIGVRCPLVGEGRRRVV